MSRGFLIFAHNNEEIDYTLIALCNALMIKANLKENAVALVTNRGSYDWLVEHQGEELVARAFDHIIFQAGEDGQTRRFRDTASTQKELAWRNRSRATAYTLSPFDETVVIDADYLIQDDTLDRVWGSSEFRINRHAITLEHKVPHADEMYVSPFTIPLYWATCFYFQKNETAKLLFDMVEHVRENYEFYRMLYRFPGKLYRNDYAFSIAMHVIGGCIPDSVDTLPSPTILTSFDCDEMIAVPGRNELTFLVNDSDEPWRFRVSKVSGINVHVMNKFSIVRCAPKLLEAFR